MMYRKLIKTCTKIGESRLFLLVALLFYSLVFIVMTWPLFTTLSTGFITDGGDGPMFVWNIEHFEQAIRNGTNPFATDQILAPLHSSLILHTLIPISGILGLLIPNPILVLNISLLASFILSGLGAYLLCYYFVKDNWMSLFVGFLFAFNPYKLNHLFEHANLMLTATIPFFILCYLNTVRFNKSNRIPSISSWKSLWIAVFLGLITLLSDYYYTLYIILFVLIHLSYHALQLESYQFLKKRNFRIAAISVVIASVLVVISKVLDIPSQGRRASINLLALILPSEWSRLYAMSIIKTIHMNAFIHPNPIENTVFFGFGLMATTVALLHYARKRHRGLLPAENSRFILFLITCFLMLAFAQIDLGRYPLCALPTVIWCYIPFVNNFRIPARYILMILLFGGIYLSQLVKYHLYPSLVTRFRPFVGIGLILICMAEYIQKSYPILSFNDMPSIYNVLSQEPAGTVLEIPSGVCSGQRMIGCEERRQMLWQMVHRKRIVGGSISRIPSSTFEFFTSHPLFGEIFHTLQDSTYQPTPPSDTTVKRVLRECQLRYVLIYPSFRHSTLEHFVLTILKPYIINEWYRNGYRLIALST